MDSFLFFVKFVKIFFGFTEESVKSCTIFLSSSINLPARRCPATYRTISWLWTPLRIANFQALFSLTTYPCFTFLFGNLCSPLRSQTNSNIAFLPSQDLLMITVNPTLFACRQTQPSNSSLSFHVSRVEKKWVVSTSLSRSLHTSELRLEASTLTETSTFTEA